MRDTETVDVCIVGGGPAGMVLALDLAQNGMKVLVLEKNADFAREFRGEILQPRFMHLMSRLGWLDWINAIPHSEFHDLRAFFDGNQIALVDLRSIDPTYPYITWMTQPDLLKGLMDKATSLHGFGIQFGASVDGLLHENNVCVGVTYTKDGAKHTVNAKIVVGADGRFSRIRQLMKSDLEFESHRFDVMWFEMPRPDSYRHGGDFFMSADMVCLVLPKHPDKIQCGILIAPGHGRSEMKGGAAKIAASLKKMHPMFEQFADELVDFKAFTILQGKIEMVEHWARNGVVLIGDAAHTCSPIAAIGVTIAAETAVVASDVIKGCLKSGDFSAAALAKIQDRRHHEVKRVHRIQDNVGRFMFETAPFRRMARHLLPLGIRLGIMPVLMRQLISRTKPL